MNFVKTVAPIAIEDLKKYFMDRNTFFIIDYKNSSLRGKKLLTYLSNLDVPSDIDFTDCDDGEFFEILTEYFNLQTLCKVEFLEKTAIAVLKEKSEILNTRFFKTFIESNSEIIDGWLSKIYSLTLYNMYIVDIPEFKKFATDHTTDDTESLIGINFVSLLKHSELYDLYQKIDHGKIKFYKNYFNEYIFKGANLYSFWANENNPMFLLTVSISSGTINGNDYISAVKETVKEIENVSPI
jgi:hypothetical protein